MGLRLLAAGAASRRQVTLGQCELLSHNSGHDCSAAAPDAPLAKPAAAWRLPWLPSLEAHAAAPGCAAPEALRILLHHSHELSPSLLVVLHGKGSSGAGAATQALACWLGAAGASPRGQRRTGECDASSRSGVEAWGIECNRRNEMQQGEWNATACLPLSSSYQ